MKEYKPLLTPWTEIVDQCLRGKQLESFISLKSVGDFIDGFQVIAPADVTGRQLEQLLKESGLDVRTPMARGSPGSFWVQLASGPFDLAHNLPLF